MQEQTSSMFLISTEHLRGREEPPAQPLQPAREEQIKMLFLIKFHWENKKQNDFYSQIQCTFSEDLWHTLTKATTTPTNLLTKKCPDNTAKRNGQKPNHKTECSTLTCAKHAWGKTSRIILSQQEKHKFVSSSFNFSLVYVLSKLRFSFKHIWVLTPLN